MGVRACVGCERAIASNSRTVEQASAMQGRKPGCEVTECVSCKMLEAETLQQQTAPLQTSGNRSESAAV